MAWDPNEPGNPAWMSKQASEYGGVENYLKNIEDNAKAEQREQDMILLRFALVGVGALCMGVGWVANKLANKKSKKKEERKEKAEEAEKAIIAIVHEEEKRTADLNETDTNYPVQ